MLGSVATHDLTVRYGAARGIEQVSLDVSGGEILGLLGPNGAGKTTWLRAVLDLVHPTSGTVSICGVESRSAKAREAVTYLPGDLRLPPRLNGAQVIQRFTAARGHIDPVFVNELADTFEVPLDRRIGSLSKGNRQKIGLILALAPQTPVLLLDEPTSGLDPLIQERFVEIVQRSAAHGTCVVLSSHVLSELEHLAGRVAVLRSGVCVAVESVQALKERTRRSWTAELGDEAAAHRVVELLQGDDSINVRRSGRVIQVELRGSINPLLRALATEDVLVLHEHSGELEDLLREYYRQTSEHT